MDYNEDDLKKSCKEVVDRVQVNDEFAEKIKRQYSQKMSKKEKFNGHAGLVFAAIAISVLVLGGGAVYALNSPAIKSAFFGENETEFEEVYKPNHREYIFENSKLVLDGVIYDKEIGLAYMSFELQTLDGTPIEQVDKDEKHFVEYTFSPMPTLVDGKINRNERYIFYKICLGYADVAIAFRNINCVSGYSDGSHYFIKVFQNEEYPSDEFDELKYSVITKEDFKTMVQEIKNLGPEYYLATNHGYPMDEYERLFSTVNPEVQDILNQYMPFETVDYKEMNVQSIDTDKCKLVFGRTDFMINYNLYDSHKSLYMVREDGSIFIILGDESMLLDEDKNKTVINNSKEWYWRGGASDTETGEALLKSEYGVILDENEKVYVVADGVKYE